MEAEAVRQGKALAEFDLAGQEALWDAAKGQGL
jgi:hypothetical protein